MVLPYIHYILYCRDYFLHLVSLHADPSHPCTRYSPPSGGPCTYLEEQLVEEVRLGEEEEHRRWDARDQLRPALEWAVKRFLGEEESKDEELLSKLLVQDDVTRALAVIKADHDRDDTLSPAGMLEEVMKLRHLITATNEGHRREKNREKMKPVVKGIAMKVLDEDVASDVFVTEVLQNEEVLEAAGKLQSESEGGERDVTPSEIAATPKFLELLGNKR